METTSAIIFIGFVVAAATQFLKLADFSFLKNINGAVVIPVAGLVGLLIALVDVQIGLLDISLATGVLTGLAAAGVVAVRKG